MTEYDGESYGIAGYDRTTPPVAAINRMLDEMEATDAINPAHYQGFSNGAQVIDIVENLVYNRGAAIKYLARAGKKDIADELEDLKKSLWYVEREIARVEATR